MSEWLVLPILLALLAKGFFKVSPEGFDSPIEWIPPKAEDIVRIEGVITDVNEPGAVHDHPINDWPRFIYLQDGQGEVRRFSCFHILPRPKQSGLACLGGGEGKDFWNLIGRRESFLAYQSAPDIWTIACLDDAPTDTRGYPKSAGHCLASEIAANLVPTAAALNQARTDSIARRWIVGLVVGLPVSILLAWGVWSWFRARRRFHSRNRMGETLSSSVPSLRRCYVFQPDWLPTALGLTLAISVVLGFRFGVVPHLFPILSIANVLLLVSACGIWLLYRRYRPEMVAGLRLDLSGLHWRGKEIPWADVREIFDDVTRGRGPSEAIAVKLHSPDVHGLRRPTRLASGRDGDIVIPLAALRANPEMVRESAHRMFAQWKSVGSGGN